MTRILAACFSCWRAFRHASRQGLANPAALKEQAPPIYKAKFDTSKGTFVIEVHRDWAPNGADRFYNLVKNGFYDDARFFRVIDGFMVQFGINGDPQLSAVWREAHIKDDPVRRATSRGFVTFATAGPEHPHDPGLHQLRRQQRPRQPGLCAVRPGRFRHERRRLRSTAATAKARRRGTDPSRASMQAEGNAYLMRAFRQARLHQEGDHDQ